MQRLKRRIGNAAEPDLRVEGGARLLDACVGFVERPTRSLDGRVLPAGQLATGSILRAGNAIDAFGLGCAAPSLTFSR